MRQVVASLSPRAWTLITAALLLLLFIPAAALLSRAYSQLKWEVIYYQRAQAETLVEQIDRDLARWIDDESNLAMSDYRLDRNVSPADDEVAGLLGRFEIDPAGNLSSPYEVSAPLEDSVAGRADSLEAPEPLKELRQVLESNRLLIPEPEESGADIEEQLAKVEATAGSSYGAERSRQAASQEAFDALSRERDVQKKAAYPSASPVASAPARRQAVGLRDNDAGFASEAVAESEAVESKDDESLSPLDASRFADTDERLSLTLMESGHAVLFRRLWRDDGRYIQGSVVELDRLIADQIMEPFDASGLARILSLDVSWEGLTLQQSQAPESRDYLSSSRRSTGATESERLLRARLSDPFDQIELRFSSNSLTQAPAARSLLWIGVMLGVVFLIAFLVLRRLGHDWIALLRRQGNFVASVSHELKTPLTSIRMYSEMLESGWVDDEKRAGYYRYIRTESERLTRLINNVLQMARPGKPAPTLELVAAPLAELTQTLKRRIDQTLPELASRLDWQCDVGDEVAIRVDRDAIEQVMINLIDNAGKFAKSAADPAIEIGCKVLGDRVQLAVRDRGPGLDPGSSARIFDLFYRAGDEMTRETPGTGIGLALVKQLVVQMGGEISGENRKQGGAEFVVTLPQSH